jgi:Sec-independent protein secretion pathway component TatC
MWTRVMRWQFAVLVGLTVLDGLVFVVPIVPTILVIGALVAPDWLRGAARFLEDLAAPG